MSSPVPISTPINDFVLLASSDDAVANSLARIGIIDLGNAILHIGIRNIGIVVPKTTLDNAIDVDIGGININTATCYIASATLAAIVNGSVNIAQSILSNGIFNYLLILRIILLAHIATDAYNAISIALGNIAIFRNDIYSTATNRYGIFNILTLHKNAVIITLNSYSTLFRINIALNLNIGHGSVAACMRACFVSEAIVQRVAVILAMNIDNAGFAVRSLDSFKASTSTVFIERFNALVKGSSICPIHILAIVNQLATGVAHDNRVYLGH